MSDLTSFSSDSKKKITGKTTIRELALKAAETLKGKDGNLLPTVKIKGKGLGYYWSPYDKKLILVPRDAEYYLLPWEEDEYGRKHLFLPISLVGGNIISVNSDELEILGYN
tara:strand:+ start:524 stop:856 length:333 start_codon:yes stop_codon:yes gene_type:complete